MNTLRYLACALALTACGDNAPASDEPPVVPQGAAGAGGQGGAGGFGGTGGSSQAGAGGAPTLDAPFEANDLSILFPLPGSAAEAGDLLGPSDEAAHGTLVPRALFNEVPALLGGASTDEIYTALRVVAARLDPCFPDLAPVPPAACRPQLRLVLQPFTPLLPFAPPAPNTADAGVHVFYDLTRDEFVSLLGAISGLKRAAGVPASGPLGVHPTVAAEGLAGPYATGLRAALRARAGAAKLTRLTVGSHVGGGSTWTFAGVDVAAGVVTPIDIAGAGARSQSVTFPPGELAPVDFSNVTVDPVVATDDDFSLFFDKATALAAPAADQRAAFAAALRVENPTLRGTEAVSCVACHTATSARLWAERSLGLDPAAEPDAFTGPFDLTLTSATRNDTKAVRGFGYRFTNPSFGQRVVAETALAVKYVNETFVTPK